MAYFLCFSKYSADNKGIVKYINLIPIKISTKYWHEIKYMVHLIVQSNKGRSGSKEHISNYICFIDLDHKICLRIPDKTKKSTFDKKLGEIITKNITPPPDYYSFIKAVKLKEDTFETTLLMKGYPRIGGRVTISGSNLLIKTFTIFDINEKYQRIFNKQKNK